MARFRSMYVDVPAILADCSAMSPAAFGGYVRLLFHMWNDGGRIAYDPLTLRKISKFSDYMWPKFWAEVSEKFEVRDGYLYQKRLTATYLRAQEISAKRKAAIDRRWAAQRDTNEAAGSIQKKYKWITNNNKNLDSSESPDDAPASGAPSGAPSESPTDGNGRTEIGSAELAAILKNKERQRR